MPLKASLKAKDKMSRYVSRRLLSQPRSGVVGVSLKRWWKMVSFELNWGYSRKSMLLMEWVNTFGCFWYRLDRLSQKSCRKATVVVCQICLCIILRLRSVTLMTVLDDDNMFIQHLLLKLFYF